MNYEKFRKEKENQYIEYYEFLTLKNQNYNKLNQYQKEKYDYLKKKFSYIN